MNQELIMQGVQLILEGIGEDVTREGLQETPRRVAKMYSELLQGMQEDEQAHLQKVFQVENNQLVVESDITFHSLCEHHMLPFWGQVHIGYVPDGRVVGLSKLARTVEVFARRLQLQERMTYQIAEALMKHLAPQGVVVMVEAEHMCKNMRGVKKPGSKTASLVRKGVFAENENLVEQFMQMINRS